MASAYKTVSDNLINSVVCLWETQAILFRSFKVDISNLTNAV